MAKVITFSQVFPAYHPKKGEKTFFVEKFWNSFNVTVRNQEFYMPFEEDLNSLNKNLPYNTLNSFNFCLSGRYNLTAKNTTIRAGNRFKKGDYFSPRVWSGKPYNSKQIIIGPDTLITDVWDVVLFLEPYQTTVCLPTSKPSQFQMLSLGEVAANDGLTNDDFERWFNPKRKSIEFHGQIICWNKEVKY